MPLFLDDRRAPTFLPDNNRSTGSGAPTDAFAGTGPRVATWSRSSPQPHCGRRATAFRGYGRRANFAAQRNCPTPQAPTGRNVGALHERHTRTKPDPDRLDGRRKPRFSSVPRRAEKWRTLSAPFIGMASHWRSQSRRIRDVRLRRAPRACVRKACGCSSLAPTGRLSTRRRKTLSCRAGPPLASPVQRRCDRPHPG
jgi:hypothetical protein